MEEEANEAWMQLLMHMVGGLFPEDCYDLINGVIFSVREKHTRITLWCNDNNEKKWLQYMLSESLPLMTSTKFPT